MKIHGGEFTVDELKKLIADSVAIESNSGCWLWRGSIGKHGYGYCKRDTAHTVSYRVHVGQIPKGLTIDHLCRVRHCVNPAHLEPVTRAENVLRGESPPARNARKTHCPNGHPYDGNSPSGRLCLTCKRANERRKYHENKKTYSDRSATYRMANKESIAAKNKAYYEANREAIRAKQNAAKRLRNSLRQMERQSPQISATQSPSAE